MMCAFCDFTGHAIIIILDLQLGAASAIHVGLGLILLHELGLHIDSIIVISYSIRVYIYQNKLTMQYGTIQYVDAPAVYIDGFVAVNNAYIDPCRQSPHQLQGVCLHIDAVLYSTWGMQWVGVGCVLIDAHTWNAA